MSDAKTKVLAKHDDDVVIIAAVRTAITKVPPLIIITNPLCSRVSYRAGKADLRIRGRRNSCPVYYAQHTPRHA